MYFPNQAGQREQKRPLDPHRAEPAIAAEPQPRHRGPLQAQGRLRQEPQLHRADGRRHPAHKAVAGGQAALLRGQRQLRLALPHPGIDVLLRLLILFCHSL